MKIEELLSKQSYLKQRLSKYWKSLSFEDALNLDSSGVMLRGSGMQTCPYSKAFPHEIHNKLVSVYPKRVNGDCYDRFLVSNREMRQSTSYNLSMLRKNT